MYHTPDFENNPMNELEFPRLFPYGSADFNDFRDEKITFTEYCEFPK